MKSKTKINFFGALFLTALFLSGGNCSAQENPSPKDAQTDGWVTIATVSVQNISSEEVSDRELKVRFDLYNEQQTQSSVRYAIELNPAAKKDPAGRDLFQGVVERKVYDDLVTVGEKETVRKEITYVIPDYLDGFFEVWLVARNDKGILLSKGMVKRAKLSASRKVVGLDLKNCSAFVSGAADAQKAVGQIVLGGGQNLSLECQVPEYDGEKVSVHPRVQVYSRSFFGKMAGEFSGKEVSLSKGGENIFRIDIPKDGEGQTYEAVVSLLGEGGKIESNPLFLKFFVSGSGASIMNVLADKNGYVKGDTAEASLFWNQTAGQNIFASAFLFSDKGRCSAVQEKNLGTEKGGTEIFKMAVDSDCPNSRLAVALMDENKKILDETAQYSEWMDDHKLSAGLGNNLSGWIYGVVGAMVIVLAGLIVFWKRKNRNTGMIASLVLIGCFSILGIGKEAEALSSRCVVSENICVASYLSDIGQDNDKWRFCLGDGFIPRTHVESLNGYLLTGVRMDWHSTNSGCFDSIFPSSSGTTEINSNFYYCDGDGMSDNFPDVAGTYSATFDNTIYYRDPGNMNSTTNMSPYSFNFYVEEGSGCLGGGTAGGCGFLNGTIFTPLTLPPVGGGRYCSTDSDYVGNFDEYPGFPFQWWWQCGTTWCYINKPPVVTVPPTVTPVCIGENSAANISWNPMMFSFDNYQIRIDTNTNVADGFWWKESNTPSLSGAPSGFVSWNFGNPPNNTAFSGYFTPGQTYYAQIAYHNNPWEAETDSPWQSFVALSCACGDGYKSDTEQCDEGVNNGPPPQACSATCTTNPCQPNGTYTWGSPISPDCSGKTCIESASSVNTCLNSCSENVNISNCNSATEPAKTSISCGPCSTDYREVSP